MNKPNPSKPSASLTYEVAGPPVDSPSSRSDTEWERQSEDQNLDKVRDILFGAQSREFEQRFRALETQLLEESAALRTDLSRSLDELKKDVHDEIRQLALQLQDEQAKQSQVATNMEGVIHQLGDKLEGKLAELQSQATQQYSTLEVHLNQQRQELSGDYSEALQVLKEQVHQKFLELQADKTDRAVLAEMLMDVALRLKVGQQNSEDS